MSIMPAPAVLVGLVVFLGVVCTYLRRTPFKSSLLPPGPPGHWLLGTAYPSARAYRQFAEWTDKYGPVYSYKQGLGSAPVVVIGRLEAATEIMEKSGAVLIDRPLSIAAGATLSGGMRVLLMPVGDRLRKVRRALHAHMQARIAPNYAGIQEANARNVILDIMARPNDHLVHARRYAASVIMTVTYGKTTSTRYSDPEVQEVTKCLDRLGAALGPGKYYVDRYPIFRYIPGYLTQWKHWHRDELGLFMRQANGVRQKMARDEALPCFVKYLIEHQEYYGLSDKELAYLAGSMFGAGTDTTAAAIGFTIMAAATHPEAQARAQAELDAVIGHQRVPTCNDEDALPQVSAFVQEVLRWRPITIAGNAHRATQDIVWKNYVIPAGATVVGNHWAISHDPDVFYDPERFDPQRWLDAEGHLRDDMKSYGFGFGRRVCPGQHLALRSVFINAALLLWSFRISEDPTKPIDTMGFTDTSNVHPYPFAVRFEPRVADLKQLLHEEDELDGSSSNL